MQERYPKQNCSLQFPLAVIDFEATALTATSYPIEVGLAIARTIDSEIEVWSALIQPHPDWDIVGQWDPDAQKLHGISRGDLRCGISTHDAIVTLNRLAAGNAVLWCDGGIYDAQWLAVLSAAGGTNPAFALADVSTFLQNRLANAEQYRRFIADSRVPHRAGPDAKRICEALKAVLEGRSDV